jgi:hypothetical protein
VSEPAPEFDSVLSPDTRSRLEAWEGYFSQLERSLDGTHHHVSVEHLPRYLAEFDFRYTTRKISDTARMERMVTQAGGRRLTYRAINP